MLFIDVVRVSSRSFKNNRLRTFLTILGISIGIGAIFFLVTLGYGFQKLILERIATSDSLLSLDVTEGNEILELNSQSVEDLKSIDGVDGVHPVINQDSQIKSEDLIADTKINIVSPEFFSMEAISAEKGTMFSEGETGFAVVSAATLELLGIDKDNFSQNEITVYVKKGSEEEEDSRGTLSSSVETVEKKYIIKGYTNDQFQPYIYIPHESVSDLNFEEFDKIKVKVVSEGRIEDVRNAIIDKGFFVSSVSEIVEQAKQIFGIAQIVLALFGIIALIVSAIGMFNTMTITLLERTQEIGIMKSLGASSFDIWKLFLAESALIGSLGGLFGLIIGFLGGRLLNFGINLLARSFGGLQVELFYTPIWFVVFIVAFSSLVGLVTGFYPARRAARLNPLEALRYK